MAPATLALDPHHRPGMRVRPVRRLFAGTALPEDAVRLRGAAAIPASGAVRVGSSGWHD